MRELAFRHREMMRLVMRTAHKQTDKAEPPDVLDFPRISRGDGKSLAVRQWGCLRAPSLMAVHRLHPGGDHSLNCDERAVVSGNRDLQAAVDLLRSRRGLQGDLIHIDEMLTQGFEVDFRPIGL